MGLNINPLSISLAFKYAARGSVLQKAPRFLFYHEGAGRLLLLRPLWGHDPPAIKHALSTSPAEANGSKCGWIGPGGGESFCFSCSWIHPPPPLKCSVFCQVREEFLPAKNPSGRREFLGLSQGLVQEARAPSGALLKSVAPLAPMDFEGCEVVSECPAVSEDCPAGAGADPIRPPASSWKREIRFLSPPRVPPAPTPEMGQARVGNLAAGCLRASGGHTSDPQEREGGSPEREGGGVTSSLCRRRALLAPRKRSARKSRAVGP